MKIRKRPELNSDLKVGDFASNYWTVSELKEFCKSNHMSVSGNKQDLTTRIEVYLRTGKIVAPKRSKESQCVSPDDINEDTIVDSGFKRNKKTTDFLKSLDSTFHYTYWMNRFIEENCGKICMRDLVTFWKNTKNQKMPDIPQDEYNLFIREFFKTFGSDQYTLNDAKKAWIVQKNIYGDNRVHQEYKESYFGKTD